MQSIACRLALGMFLAMAGPPLAAAQQDRLERIDRAAGEYRGLDGIGQIVTDEGHGTGVLISPCHVMTNYHVAFGTAAPAAATGRRIFLQVGQTAPSHQYAFRSVHPLEVLVWGDYLRHRRAGEAIEKERQDRNLQQGDPEWERLRAAFMRAVMRGAGEDWALLRIVGGQRSPHPYVRLARNVSFRDLGDKEVGIAGFPGYRGDRDGFRNLWGQFDCRAASGHGGHPDLQDETGRALRAWPLRCGFTRFMQGMSGAPLLARAGADFVVLGLYASRFQAIEQAGERAEISGVAPAERFAAQVNAAMQLTPCRP